MVWRCEGVEMDVEVWRCEGVQMWGMECVEMRGCGDGWSTSTILFHPV